jgi:opacity protein-like surface antigen
MRLNQLLTYKLISLVILSVFFVKPIHAQDNKLEIGIEGGPSLTTLRSNLIGTSGLEIVLSSITGLTFQNNFTETISFRSGINYENKGASIESRFTDEQGHTIGSAKFRYNYHYITLPLLIKASFGNKTKFFINGGPYVGYLLKQTFPSPAINVNGTSSESNTIDNTEYHKRIDFGLTGGLGLSFSLGVKTSLNTELRYNHGLTNTLKNPARNYSTKTSSINILIGLAFKLGAKE